MTARAVDDTGLPRHETGPSPYNRRVSTTPADPLVGALLDGRYRVLEHIADGGMASVYLAVDTRLEREIALKIMRPHLVTDEAFITRFRREARSAAQLSHPNIVAVHDQGEDAGRMFLAMEYVPGRTLRQVLDAEGALSPRAAFDIIDPVLSALAAAHRAGIIHRDIKPENVILRDDGIVKVADFGLARSVGTQTVTSTDGMLIGTVAYLSPEQVERGVADARSDVYAAGLILFEMLTGAKAFTGETPINVAYQHVHAGVPALSSRVAGVPPALDDLVARATDRDPDERPADARVFLHEVRRVRALIPPDILDRTPARTGPGGATPASEDDLTAPLTSSSQTQQVPHVARTALLPLGAAAPDPPPTPVQPPDPPGPAAAEPPSRPGSGRTGAGRSWPWVLAGLAVLVFGATLWAFTVGPLSSVTVPRIAGKPVADAQRALTAEGLTSTLRESFSETVAKGNVVSTDPQGGESVWKWTVVSIVVSKGPERYAVPELAGRPLIEALNQLNDAHLTAGTQTEAWSDTVTAGSVISTDPAAGTPLKSGAAVNLTVSKGKQPIEIVDWTGKSASAAVKALEGLGLTVDASAHENSETVAKGAVISQTPASGTLHKGDKVTLVVSDGPPLVDVPDVVGKQVDVARAALTDSGFKVKVQSLFGGIFGTVRFQDPAGGKEAPKGSMILLKTV